jgi:hypothetical protein
MIEKSFTRKISSYGELSMNAKDGLIFNGGEIIDFSDLVQKCLTSER